MVAQEVDLAGRIMVGTDGPVLTAADCQRLAMPAVGGVCLFGRNYESGVQLRKLVAAIRAAAPRPLVIAVDQEGGRVQRFGPPDFVQLPPAGTLGRLFADDPEAAIAESLGRGETISRSLAEMDIDLTFAPVLDLNHDRNKMIGERAFAASVEAVTSLALAFCAGLAAHGLKAVGKHFPGHGWAVADSHQQQAVDGRSRDEILGADTLPYETLLKRKMLAAIMTAHVTYPAFDSSRPATFSAVVIKQLLRRELNFGGAVISDDLVMQGATVADTLAGRARLAVAAGCDLLLICGGEPNLVDQDLTKLPAVTAATPWRALTRSTTSNR